MVQMTAVLMSVYKTEKFGMMSVYKPEKFGIKS